MVIDVGLSRVSAHGNFSLNLYCDLRHFKKVAARQQDLQQQVGAKTNEVLLAKDRAETVNRAKSEFLANMSREIQTPMNVVLCFTELLKKTEKNPQKVICQWFQRGINC